MGLETGTYIDSLVSTNPVGSDLRSVGDDHLRLIKATVKASFPDVDEAVVTIHNASSAPSSKQTGTVWRDTSASLWKFWNGSGWITLPFAFNTSNSVDINAGTIDGVTAGTNSAVTELQVDNINVNGNAITSTDTDGDITITPNGAGEIVLDGQKWPVADGDSTDYLTTNGSGQIAWTENTIPASVTAAAASASTATTQAGIATTQAGIATAKAVLTASDAVDTAADAVSTAADVVSADAAAGASAFRFTFDNATSMANPTGTGGLRFNHSSISSVTAFAFDAVSADSGNPDISDLIASIDDGTNSVHEGYIFIRKRGTLATYAAFNVTGAVTDNTSWLQVPVTHSSSNGTLSASDILYISFVRSGNVGATGATGPSGGVGNELADNVFRIQDNSDATKEIAFEASGITTGTTRTVTMPDSNVTLGTPLANTVDSSQLVNGSVDIAHLSATGTAGSTNFLRGDNSWQVVSVPKLDSPTITGTLSVLSGGTVTHTIANWSDDVSYTITPTNCTAGTVNGSGEFVITSTGGAPSYTIVATTDSLGLDDSSTVTKNITLQLTAPTLSSPADSYETVNVTYTVTSTTTDDDKIILNIGSSNFTYQSVSHGSGSKVGNTVEVTGFTTNNPAIVIQFTAEATYSVTATSVKIDGSFATSPASSADSITILNPTLSAPAISSPADVGTATNVAYTITSNDANDNKLILNIGSSNFTYQSVSVGSASKVGNTVECTSFSTNNPVVTIQYTAEATYSVTAAAYDTTGYYHDSANSGADSIIISNYAYGGTNYGYFCGGWNGSWPSTTNAIEKYSYSSGANATPVGTMTYTAMAIACGQSDTYGYTAGGYHAPVYRNQMGKYSFSSEGASSTVGTMVSSAGWISGVSSETHFYVHGGGGNAEKIGKTSFASGGNLSTTYNGGNNIADGGSCTSQYYGYAAGGSSYGTNYYRYAFASDTSISVYGTVPAAKDGTDGWSSSTKGYFVGGATDDIKGFTFASGGLQADVGNLVNSNYYSATTSSTTYGYIAGQAPSYNSLIQRMSFSSEGNAVDTTYDLTKSYGYTNGFQY